MIENKIVDIIRLYKWVWCEYAPRTDGFWYAVDIKYNNNSIMFYIWESDINYEPIYHSKVIWWEQCECPKCWQKIKEKVRIYDTYVYKKASELTNRDKIQQRKYLSYMIFKSLQEIGYEWKKIL